MNHARRLRRARNRLAASAVLLAGLLVHVPGAAASAWWEERSTEERHAIVNHFFHTAGHSMPYPEQGAVATGSITHLREGTPLPDRGRLGTQLARDGVKAKLLPPLKDWVPRLAKGGAAGIAATVAISLEYDTYQRLYAHWSLDATDHGTSVTVTDIEYYPVGANIYEGATSRGEWLVNGTINFTTFTPVRWFQSPCTFSGFVPPHGSRMRYGVPTSGSLCSYSIDAPPYYDYAQIRVNYPYFTEDDLQLTDFPVIAPYGSYNQDYSRPRAPKPALGEAESLLESALEAEQRDELRRRLLVAIAAERILQNNPTPVASGDLDPDRARTIADACITHVMISTALHSSDCGREGLPMFVSGSDYPEATAHIARGLVYNPPWVRLRYYQRPDSERSWKDQYPETDDPDAQPPCKGSLVDGTACDEFPFLKAEQGALADSSGVAHAVRPHLKIIDASQNSGSGGKYGDFVTRCRMQQRRDSLDPRHGFGNLVVIPAVGPVPTLGLCNGTNPLG